MSVGLVFLSDAKCMGVEALGWTDLYIYIYIYIYVFESVCFTVSPYQSQRGNLHLLRLITPNYEMGIST
jgi:hypothetical protein